MRLRLWPRSLAGQMAFTLAIALFVAQAINFSLMLQDRRTLLFNQVIGPAVTRIIDAVERGRPIEELAARRPSARLRVASSSPVTTEMRRLAGLENALMTALSDAGYPPRSVEAGVRRVRPDDPRLRDMSPRRAQRLARSGQELIVGVERAPGQWLVFNAPWRQGEEQLIWRLIGQTLVLYGIILLPVIWIGRRISRPLATLAVAARGFRPGTTGDALPEEGPADVRDVIAAFNALRLRVNGMIDEKDRMLGAIGHDLRTPLAALRVRVESVEDDHDRERMAETIDEMNRTLDDILSLARLGRPSEPAGEVDVAALVDAVVDDFRDIGADVTMAESPRMTMRLRPGLMKRAVRNLIENAVKYGERARVSVVADAGAAGDKAGMARGGVRIIVADDGPGIPPDRMADVFDAFTRLETSRNRETGGAGLGLALARAIVNEAGGTISLVNRAGGGLDAVITLPKKS